MKPTTVLLAVLGGAAAIAIACTAPPPATPAAGTPAAAKTAAPAAAATAAPVVTAAPQTTPQAQPPATPQGRVVIAVTGLRPDFDPLTTLTGGNTPHFRALFDGLSVVKRDGTLEPRLAESWRVLPDNNGWEFTIRDGLRFQNGDPVNSEALAWSFNWIRDPANRSAYATTLMGQAVTAVETPNPRTLILRTSRPAPILPRAIASINLTSPRLFTETQGQGWRSQAAGTGAFQLSRATPDQEVVVVPSQQPTPHRGLGAKTAEVVYRVIPEAATRIAAIRTGEVDIVAGLEGDQVRNLQRDGNKLFQADANFVLTMTMNPFVDSPVRDPRVRRAAIASIDRAAIVEGVYAGQANVANQPAPPSANGHDPQMPPQPFDVQQARQLLAEAGFPNGFQSKMHVLSSSQPFITTGTAVAGFLETIGIRVEIEQVSGAAYQTLFNNGPFHPFAVNNYTAPAQDADAQLDWFLSTAPEGRRRYVNPNFDRVLLQSKQEMDATRRTQLLREASRILVTEDPVQAYLVWPIQNYVARPRVENFTALPANFDIDGMFVTR